MRIILTAKWNVLYKRHKHHRVTRKKLHSSNSRYFKQKNTITINAHSYIAKLFFILKLYILFIFYIGLFASGCSNQKPEMNLQSEVPAKEVKVERAKTPAELRKELRILEESNPSEYLKAQATLQENKILVQAAGLFSHSKYAIDGYLLTGTINNTASVAKFKDAVITISFISETNTPIMSNKLVLYKYLNPNETIPFEFKVYAPKESKNFKIKIKDAVAVH